MHRVLQDQEGRTKKNHRSAKCGSDSVVTSLSSQGPEASFRAVAVKAKAKSRNQRGLIKRFFNCDRKKKKKQWMFGLEVWFFLRVEEVLASIPRTGLPEISEGVLTNNQVEQIILSFIFMHKYPAKSIINQIAYLLQNMASKAQPNRFKSVPFEPFRQAVKNDFSQHLLLNSLNRLCTPELEKRHLNDFEKRTS